MPQRLIATLLLFALTLQSVLPAHAGARTNSATSDQQVVQPHCGEQTNPAGVTGDTGRDATDARDCSCCPDAIAAMGCSSFCWMLLAPVPAAPGIQTGVLQAVATVVAKPLASRSCRPLNPPPIA